MPQENQHYVPRFMLRMFSNGKKPKVFVLDKSNDNEFQSNVKNLASEKGFYEIEIEEGVLSAEARLSKMEAQIAKVSHPPPCVPNAKYRLGGGEVDLPTRRRFHHAGWLLC